MEPENKVKNLKDKLSSGTHKVSVFFKGEFEADNESQKIELENKIKDIEKELIQEFDKYKDKIFINAMAHGYNHFSESEMNLFLYDSEERMKQNKIYKYRFYQASNNSGDIVRHINKHERYGLSSFFRSGCLFKLKIVENEKGTNLYVKTNTRNRQYGSMNELVDYILKQNNGTKSQYLSALLNAPSAMGYALRDYTKRIENKEAKYKQPLDQKQ